MKSGRYRSAPGADCTERASVTMLWTAQAAENRQPVSEARVTAVRSSQRAVTPICMSAENSGMSPAETRSPTTRDRIQPVISLTVASAIDPSLPRGSCCNSGRSPATGLPRCVPTYSMASDTSDIFSTGHASWAGLLRQHFSRELVGPEVRLATIQHPRFLART